MVFGKISGREERGWLKVLIAEENDGPVRNKATWSTVYSIAATEVGAKGKYLPSQAGVICLFFTSHGSQLELIKLHEDSCVSQPSSNTVAMVKEAKGNSLCAIIVGSNIYQWCLGIITGEDGVKPLMLTGYVHHRIDVTWIVIQTNRQLVVAADGTSKD
ncbi:hypothetical protein E3N88_16477 [Mikania micrantha]|uniref:Uncharacterized protein n=1 Tax=Mikania micrantha TaxID=192012 RepID=A0A5N6NZR5_9ASTR|nr:hypothetical protein E3N88_16477 [Mikania micrantha]